MFLRSLALAGLAASLLAGSALAAPTRLDDLNRFPPPLREKVLKRLTERQRATPSSPGLDTTPPAVAALSVGRVVQADSPLPGLPAEFTLTDDLSGVQWAEMWIRHRDTGATQTVTLLVGGNTPVRHEQGKLLLSYNWSLYAPGTWDITDVYLRDVAGNYARVEQAQLTALGGNLSFEVRNRLYDRVDPVLKSGVLLASQVSRSTPWSGTTSVSPMLNAEITVLDKRSVRASGVADAHFHLCTADESDCLLVTGSRLARPGRSVLQLSATLLPEQTLGTYYLHSLYVYDRAGPNFNIYTSTRFGGVTDFSRYFPVTQVEITP